MSVRLHDTPPAPEPGGCRRSNAASGVQVGNPGALELRDHVFEHELPLLEAAQHDLIDVRVVGQSRDDLIQILVLNAQLF